MPTIRRLFGIANDATPGGTDFDGSSSTIADATTFYPVTGGTFEANIERTDRNTEVRGRRANTNPLPFRAAPLVTVPVAAYRTVLEKVLYMGLGQVDTTGGGPYVHTLTPVGFGNIALPAAHVQIIRDDLNVKMLGGSVNRVTMNFPLDGEGNAEVEFWGKWSKEFSTAAPTATFTGLSNNPMYLRDAKVYVDGSGTAVQDLQGVTFAYVNNLTRKWYAGRNVESRSLGSPSPGTKKLWWPSENKAQGAPDIQYSVQFGNVETAQEVASWFSQIQKFVFEFTGDPITGGTETIKITLFNTVHTGGGAEQLTAREDITATFEGGAFYSTADAGDLEIEITSDTPTLT